MLQPWPTKICHIWMPKLRGQLFKRTWQSEDKSLYYVLVGFVYSAIFLPKRQNQITFRTMLKNFNMKNIKFITLSFLKTSLLILAFKMWHIWSCVLVGHVSTNAQMLVLISVNFIFDDFKRQCEAVLTLDHASLTGQQLGK